MPFASEANAVVAGFELSVIRAGGSTSSSTTHGYVVGGSNNNTIDKYSFAATSGTATDVGDLRYTDNDICGGFQY